MTAAQLTTFQTSAIVIFCLMISTWLISLARKDAGIIDICWGLGFAAITWVLIIRFEAQTAVGLVLTGLTTVWAVRLSVHLAFRNLGKPEDFRYRAMRERWGSSFPFASLVIVFGLQGTVMWLVSLPLQMALAAEEPSHPVNGLPLLIAGICLWGVGFFFESVGDWQLSVFRRDPESKGRVLDTGLWRYTRHPNYFGDCLVWWGLFLVCVVESGAWWTVVSPLLMTFLLLRVSGVTLLEQTLRESKPEYADYVARTNAFLPGIPKQNHEL